MDLYYYFIILIGIEFAIAKFSLELGTVFYYSILESELVLMTERGNEIGLGIEFQQFYPFVYRIPL